MEEVAFQAQDNMLSVIQKFLSNAPPSCDVEISVKYNLSKDNTQLPKTSTIRMNTAAANENTRPFTEPRRIGSATFMPRKLRSEERMALKDAIPILTPEKKTESSTKYEPLPDVIKTERDEVNVSAEPILKKEKKEKRRTKKADTSDAETEDLPTSELFPVKKALRYNKNSGKYDDISY